MPLIDCLFDWMPDDWRGVAIMGVIIGLLSAGLVALPIAIVMMVAS